MPLSTSTQPSREDVEIVGRALFQNFVQEELAHQGLPEDAIDLEKAPPEVFEEDGLEEEDSLASPEDHESPALARSFSYHSEYLIPYGAAIKDFANRFRKSEERGLIKEQADQVDIGRITQSSFHNMLLELFNDGIIDEYRIVALFYFCSDVLVRCVQEEPYKTGCKLFFWSLKFLVRRVSKWVYEHGGWGHVLSNVYDSTIKVFSAIALCVVITCGIVYIRKNL